MAKHQLFSIDNLSRFKVKLFEWLPTEYATKNHTHTVDSALSETSSNPIQNKIVTAIINELEAADEAINASLGSHKHDSAYKKIQTAVSSPSVSGSTTSFIDTISQDTQGKITATRKNIDFSNYKQKQTAVSDPTASGTGITFIDTISQDVNGVITPTKKTVRTMEKATSSAAGTTGLVPAPAAGKQSSFLRGDGTWVVPTDTKNTAGSTNSSSKLFLIGAASQAANPQTYSHDTVYIGTDSCLYSNDKKVSVEGHNHDDAYYLQSQLDAFLNAKVDKVSGKGLSTNDFTTALLEKLNGIATGAQVNTVTGVKGSSETSYRTGNINITKTNIGLGNVDNTSDANKPISTAQQAAIDAKANKATTLSGYGITNAYTKTEVNNLISPLATSSSLTSHNTDDEAHNDIRLLITNLTKKVTDFLDVTDEDFDTVSEFIAYVEANRNSIVEFTTSKINISDIVDNLTTSSTTKVLSAKQGVTLKSLVDGLSSSKANVHSHPYAGSSEQGGAATSANKLNTDAGSATQPIYFLNGIPVKTDYTIAKSVPSNAVFTDTTYSNFVKSGTGAKAGLVPAPSTTAGTTKYLREDGTWTVPPNDNTTYNVVSNSANGLVPKTGTTASATIGTQSTEWVLTSTSGGTPTWRKLPENAFKNDNTTSFTITANVSNDEDTIVSLTGTNGSNAVTYKAVHAVSGATAGSYGDSSNQTPNYGSTFKVPYISINNTGHVTGISAHTITIPSTLSNGTGTAGLIKTSSTVTSSSGYTACPVISGIPYYKDTNIDTKVTAVGNHYVPSGGSTISASSTTAATWGSTDMVTGVTVDAAGHVTGVTSIQMPANPNSDTNVTQAYSTTNANYPLLFSATSGITSTSSRGATTSILNNGIYANPSTSSLYATKFIGALTGNADTATKVNTDLVIKLNSGTTEGTNLFTFNGSTAKTINITPSSIGAAASSHGTHVTYGTNASALGTSSAGSASTVSRSDHVHALPELTSCTGTLTVAKGGTSATTADSARINMKFYVSGYDTLPSSFSNGTIIFYPV